MIASKRICLNIICTLFFTFRYHIWHKSRSSPVSKIHLTRISGCANPMVYECAFLNLAIYTVFSTFHHRNLIQSIKIYLEHTWRVSIYNITVALIIISVRGHLSTREYQVKMNLMASFPYLALKNIQRRCPKTCSTTSGALD